MTTNEVLTKQNFLTKLVLKDNENELSKNLKVKIMKMRIEYAKIRKAFDEDLQEFVKDLAPERFRELQQIPENERTDEQNQELTELTNKINEDYNAYIIQRGQDEVNVNTVSFTEEEFEEILEVNSGNNVEINGTKVPAADFMEIIYTSNRIMFLWFSIFIKFHIIRYII